MISISPIKYLDSIKRLLTFVSLSSDKKVLTFTVANGTNIRTYNGKRITVEINNSKFTGVYNCNSNGIKTLTFDSPINVSASSEIICYETFKVNEDNQTLTAQDIHELFETQPAQDINTNRIEKAGKSGLLSGFDKSKLDNLMFEFKQSEKVSLINNLKRICNIKLSNSNINNYRIILCSESIPGIFDALITVSPDVDYYSVKILSHLLDGNQTDSNDFKLKLSKLKFQDNINYLAVDLGFVNNTLPNKKYEFQLFVGCKQITDLTLPTNTFISETLLLNNKDVTVCDKTLVSADKFSEQRLSYDGETILRSITKPTNNCYQLNCGYYLFTRNNKPNDLPVNNFETATITVFKDEKALLLITNENQLFLGKKKSDTQSVEWLEVSVKNHKHNASDIIEDEQHKFVTAAEKQSLTATNQTLTNTVWKQHVADESKLPVNTVINTIIGVDRHASYGGNPVVLQNLGNNRWVPVNGQVFQTDITETRLLYPGLSGSLISPDLLNKISNSGIGKKLKNNEQFIHVENNNQNYVASNNKFMDIVFRNNMTSIGNNVISFGFNISSTILDDSIIIGSNIKQTLLSKTIVLGSDINAENGGIFLGSFNKVNGKNKFTIGDGESDTMRSNLFWIDRFDNVTVKQNGSFKIDGVDNTELLTSGGHVPQTSFVTSSDFERFKDTMINGECYNYFQHEPKNKTENVPVIICISQPANVAYYRKTWDPTYNS